VGPGIGADAIALGGAAEAVEVVGPAAMMGVGGVASPLWIRRTVVAPSGREVRSISTVVDPGGIWTSGRSQP